MEAKREVPQELFNIFNISGRLPAWEKPGLKASEKRENQIDLIPWEHYLLWKSSGNSKTDIYCGKKSHIKSGGRWAEGSNRIPIEFSALKIPAHFQEDVSTFVEEISVRQTNFLLCSAGLIGAVPSPDLFP